MTSKPEDPMPATLTLEGVHAQLASPDEIAAAIKAAAAVFADHGVEPLACAAANAKFGRDEPLTHDEALLYVIWNIADDQALRAATLGWLVRDVDIRLAAGPAP
jgi:hypothetical protein